MKKLIPFTSFRQNRRLGVLEGLYSRIDRLLDSARAQYVQSEELKKVVAADKSAVESSSVASHQISSMVTTTAEAGSELLKTAMTSNQAVESSVAALAELTALVGKVSALSESLKTTVNSSVAEIASVTETMSEIKEKATIINEIVFQTKLLSFNASVEAARAGEHGRGFAVVAEEMGNLAKASGAAAKEIEAILEQSVARTQEQVERVTKYLEGAMRETVSAISDVSTKSVEISGAFAQLSRTSQTTATKANEISTATAEQKTGVSRIAESLQQLERASDKLNDMAEASHKNSADLAAEVDAICSEFLAVSNELGYSLRKPKKVFDFDAAVRAHVDWKMKLTKYMELSDGSLDQKLVSVDGACALGKWLYGDGASYKGEHPQAYEALRIAHAEFHKTAGKIVGMIDRGEISEAERLLAHEGAYGQVSARTVELIRELQARVEGVKAA